MLTEYLPKLFEGIGGSVIVFVANSEALAQRFEYAASCSYDVMDVTPKSQLN